MGLVADIINFCSSNSGLQNDDEIEMEDMGAIRYRKERKTFLATIEKASAESPEIGGADVGVTFASAEQEARDEYWEEASALLKDAHRKAELVLKRKPYLTLKVANEPKIKVASKIKIANPKGGKPYGEEVEAKWKSIQDLAKKDDIANAAAGVTELVKRIDGEIATALQAARNKNKEDLDRLKIELAAAKGNPEKLKQVAVAIFKNTGDAEELGIDTGENARKPFTEEQGGAWTAKNCEDTFVAYDWFALKKCRKDKTIKLAGKDRAFSDDDMWKLVQYRGKVVNAEIDKLRKKYPTLIASATGSEDIESDIDIAFATPNSGDDVKAAQEFNTAIKKRFKKPPGRVFDVNIYPRDYRALRGDSFKPSYSVDENKDVGIDEPDQAESLKLSKIDQDVATLLKQRRFLDEGKFNEMLKDLLSKAPDEKTKNRIEKQYEEGEDIYLQTSLEKVAKIRAQVKLDDNSTDKHVLELKKYLGDLDKIKGKGGKENLALAQRLIPKILDLFEEGFPDESMDVTDALYLEKMGDLRDNQEQIRDKKATLETLKPAAHPGQTCKEAGHEEVCKWQKEFTALNALEVKVKKDMFTNIIFANEAIMSQGALDHVLGALQAKTEEDRKGALDKLTASDLMQSVNEQVADLFKEMKHFENVVHEAEEAAKDQNAKQAAKNSATGEGYVHASKYFFRLLDAAILLNEKYPKEETVQAPYDAIKNELNQSLVDLKKTVNDVLLKLRKSAVIPPDVKGEVGALEMQRIFKQVTDIPSFRTMISNFAIELNKRIRSLEEFKKSQEMDATAEREAETAYFKAAAPNEAKPGSKEDAENQIRILLNKPLAPSADLTKHLEAAGVKGGGAITNLWIAAAGALNQYKQKPDAAPETLRQFAAAIDKVGSADVKAALMEAKDKLAEKLEILKLANDNSGEFRSIESDFAQAEEAIANAATFKALAETQKNATRQFSKDGSRRESSAAARGCHEAARLRQQKPAPACAPAKDAARRQRENAARRRRQMPKDVIADAHPARRSSPG